MDDNNFLQQFPVLPHYTEVLKKYADQFEEIELVTIDDDFGGWTKAQEKHFSDGGTFDQIYIPSN